MCVHIHAHIHIEKKPNIKIWNTCTARYQFHLYQFVGPHWSRQWLGVVRQQAISWAKVALIVVMWHHWVALGDLASLWIYKKHRCEHVSVSYTLTYTHIHIRTKMLVLWFGMHVLTVAVSLNRCYYHHQIGSINLTHYHVFPWLCTWDVCYIIFCLFLHIHSGKTGILFSLLLCSLWWMQIVRYVLARRSCS